MQPAEHGNKTSLASKKRWIAIGFVLVLLAVLAGFIAASRDEPVVLQATVEAKQVNVSTKVLARAERVLVDTGDLVRKGQVMAELTAPDIDALVTQTQALTLATQSINTAVQTGPREENIASLGDVARASRAAAGLAQRTASRMERLFEQGVVSAQRRDEATSAAKVADLNAQAAEAQFARVNNGFRPEARSVTEAARDAAESLLEASTQTAQELQLVAPISGRVSQRLIENGEVVAPALPALQILDIENPYLVLRIPETAFSGVSEGARYQGRVVALGKTLTFRVSSIAPQASFSSQVSTSQRGGFDERVFEVRLKPITPEPDLRPGMSVLFDWSP